MIDAITPRLVRRLTRVWWHHNRRGDAHSLGDGCPAPAGAWHRVRSRWARGRALRAPLDASGLQRVFSADTLWGVAALLWIATGLLRAFAGLEKGTAYYLQSHAFWIKMALLGGVLLLEVWPMITLIRWRRLRACGQPFDTRVAPVLARISEVQAILVVAMVFAATAMARGLGF